MTHNTFEKQIKDKLNQYEVQPGEEMLDSIFEKRASKKSPLMGWSRIGLVAAIAVVTISALYFYNAGGTGETPGMTSKPEAVIPDNNPSEMAPSVSQNSIEKQSSAKTSARKDQAINRVSGGAKAGQLASATPQGIEKAKSSSGKRKSSDRTLASHRMVSHVPEQSGSVPDKGSNFKGDNGNDIYNRYFNINAKNRPVIEKIEHNGNSHLYVYQSVSESVLDNYSFVSMPSKRLNKFDNVYHLENEAKVSQVDIKRLTKTGHRPLFVDFLYMPTYTGVKATDSELQGDANSIKKSAYNSQYGVRVTMPVCQRISLFTGVFYQNQSTVYQGTVNKPQSVTRIISTDRFINDPVTMQVVKVTTYDTVSGVENRGYNYDFKNSYTLFQLPLGLSYNFGYKKFDFAVNGSALINMFTNSQGRAMNMESNNTSAFASSGKYYGVGAGLSFMSALKISPKFRLIFEPGLQYYKIDGIRAGNNINEKILNKQLTIGLRYSVF